MRPVIIIGDSSHNTLSVIRSLGRAKVKQTLILKTDDDICNVASSRYLKKSNVFRITNIEEIKDILSSSIDSSDQLLVCTFDEAALWIDSHETSLSRKFTTPCRGQKLSDLFYKDIQCKLASEHGLTVPKSKIYKRGEDLCLTNIQFPVILKPQRSTEGEKSDIHICRNLDDINGALKINSRCTEFIIQEFIEKEYELDCIGVSTDDEVIISGAVRKIRHYPQLIGAGAFGKFIPISTTNIDCEGISQFIRKSGYHGPFSVEFLHTADGRNYFMEVNFRNEGLAYASTCAGANLHAVYAEAKKYKAEKVRSCYMMNFSLDYLYVKSGEISLWSWLKDFIRTRCYINFSFRDPMPSIRHYLRKFKIVK